MPQQQVDGLDAARSRRTGFPAGIPPDAEYTFKHALVQDAAYSTMLRGRRQHIHARVATTLESQFPEIAAAQPQLMAYHCRGRLQRQGGRLSTQGRPAGGRAVGDDGAVALQRGLELLANMPEEFPRPVPTARTRPADRPRAGLMAASGYSAPVVSRDTSIRARALSRSGSIEADRLAPLLYFQSGLPHSVRAEHKLAVSRRADGEIRATQETIEPLCCWVSISTGASCYYRGEFVTARGLLELCDGLRECQPARAIGRHSWWPIRSAASLGPYLALTLALLGHIDQDARVSTRR